MDTTPRASRSLRFGRFELDVRARELRENGTRLRVQEQSFQILLMLLERPGDVVLREEIRQKLWPDNTVVEFDHSINAAIKRLRQVLGESAEASRHIETLAKRGYRFLGEVERVPEPGAQTVLEAPQEPPIGRFIRPGHVGWLVLGLSAVLFVALPSVVFLVTQLRKSTSETLPVRFSILPPENTFFGGLPSPAVSPDGRRIVFAVYSAGEEHWKLWLRSLDSVSPVPLPGTEGDGTAAPFWSPDGRSVGFASGTGLKRIDIGGPSGPEQVITLCSVRNYNGGAWNRQGVILFSDYGILYRITDKGGSPIVVTRPDAGFYLYPSFLPDGRHFVFEAATLQSDRVTIRAGSLDSQVSKILLEADSNAIFVQGHLLYVRDSTLYARPFDPQQLMTTGVAVPLAERLSVFQGYGNFSASLRGPLVYASSSGAPPFELVWFDRKDTRLSTLGGVRTPLLPPNNSFSLAPDQKTVAIAHREAGTENTDIWLYGTAQGIRTRLTFGAAKKVAPVWSPDGNVVVFSSSRRGHFDLYRQAAYGSGSEELVYADDNDKYPTSWSSDGKYLLYDRVSRTGRRPSIWVLPLKTDGSSTEIKPSPLMFSEAGERNGQFSPDGRWVAYESPESGRFEIYLVPFRANADSQPGKRQVSTNGGRLVKWRRDGNEIFYRSERRLLAAAVSIKDSTVRIGEERQMIGALSLVHYDVSSDGQRFLVQTRPRRLISEPLIVVQNWAASLDK